MSFFGKIRKKFFNDLSPSDPKAWNPSLWNLFGSHSLSGEVVTEETALNYSAVWCAINLISGTVGGLPLNLMQKEGESSRVATEDPLHYVMHTKTNPYMNAMTFSRTGMAHALTNGNWYAEILRNGMGEVYALYPIPPRNMNEIKVDSSGMLMYHIQVDSTSKWLPQDKVLHIAGLGYDGLMGYSPIAMARKSIGLSMALETFGSLYFGQGTHPGVVVEHPNKLDEQTHANLKKSLTETYSGLGQSHRLMLLEDGMKMDKMAIDPEDSQFLQTRGFQIPEIARWYNLPPHKLRDLTKSSFSNIESEQISFLTDSILPWLIQIEKSLDCQLLTDEQRKNGLFFRHNFDGLLRANSKDRAMYYKIMIGTGAMKPNEARVKEDMNPSDDPLANELWMPTGLVPMSKFGEYLSKNQGQPAVMPEDDDEDKDDNIEDKRLKLIEMNNKK